MRQHLVFFLSDEGYVKDNSQARRLILDGAVKVDGVVSERLDTQIDDAEAHTIEIGQRQAFVYSPTFKEIN